MMTDTHMGIFFFCFGKDTIRNGQREVISIDSKYNRPNRLIHEKSPYLLQHAHNPVNWYPWSEEAFKKAQSENKPIFLSIGYSTCHWCHVMARESFEDEQIAQLLNTHFVSIKVDREERPDIDSLYMKVCQMMTGHGGWPLHIFMTHEQIPFYTGTYFPKESKYGIPGFGDVVVELYERYKEDPDHIESITKKVQQALEQTVESKSSHRLTNKQVDEAYDQLRQQYDSLYGGFGKEPKFPQPQHLFFLLRYNERTGEKHALKMVDKTLHAMGKGGLYDHVGFGFSRYSTDEKWLVPHFEKMLYDNALLLIAYVEGYQVTEDPYFKQIAEQIITFVQREMTADYGAFYSAIDADAEGEEGKYYVWEYEEIMHVLGNDLGSLFAFIYDITPQGNFEGKNIPNRIQTPPTATAFAQPISEQESLLDKAREQLLQARQQRVYPHVDNKVLTSWNAMMIIGMAKAGKVYGNQTYLDIAKQASHFVEKYLMSSDRIMARYRDGETKYKGYLDDYAYVIWSYVELYEATWELHYIEKGKQIAHQMIELFWDESHGGFFLTGKDAEQLIAKDKEIYDGALPSGNSVAAVVLMKLVYLTGDTKLMDYVNTMYASFYTDVTRQASAASFFIQSLFLSEYPTKQIVVIGDKEDPKREALLTRLQRAFIPNVTILVGKCASDFAEIAPFAASYESIEEQTTVYICEHFACKAPTTDTIQAYKDIVEES